MLVKPTYKPVWGIPCGVVELNESPKHCCEREVWEELGIGRKIGDLLVVDYNSETKDKTESLMFIFNGGVLTLLEIESVQLRQDESSGFHFFNVESLPHEMTDTLRRRVLAAWQQVTKSNGIYLENQEQK